MLEGFVMRTSKNFTYVILFLCFFLILLTIFLKQLLSHNLFPSLEINSFVIQLVLIVVSLTPLYLCLVIVIKYKKRDAATQLETEKYKISLEKSSIAAYIIKEDVFIYVTPAFADLFGYSPEEIYKNPISMYDLLYEEYHHILSVNKDRLLDSEDIYHNYQVKGERKDGTELDLDMYPTWQYFNGQRVAVGNVINVTEKRLIQKELEKKGKILTQAQKIAGILYWEFDNVKNKLTWSAQIYELFGLPHDHEPNFEYLLSKVHPEDRDTLINSRKREIDGESILNIYRFFSKNGSVRTLHSISQSIFDRSGKPIKTIGTMQDITDRLVEEQKLELTKNRYKSLFDHNLDSVFSLNPKGNFLSVNEMGIKTFGYSNEEIIQLKPLKLIVPEYRERVARLFNEVLDGEPKRNTIQVFHKEGRTIDLDITVLPIILKSSVTGVFCLAKNITKQREHVKTIEQLAYHDHLTGLPNRRKLLELMHHHIEDAKKDSLMMGILYIDLDRLKYVNDNLGHEYGDKMIIEAGNRILRCIRPVDYLARVGGDEFILVIPNISDIEGIIEIAKQIFNAFKPGFNFDKYLFRTTASIGISVYPKHGEDVNELVSKADKAMYFVKTHGRNFYKVFEDSMKEEEVRRFQIQNEFESSLLNGNFF